jgi:hypothetical protein
MAIIKEIEISKIEVVRTWNIQVATDTVIKEDGTEISRSRHRHVLQPYGSELKRKIVDDVSVIDLDADGKKQWTHTDTDISGEEVAVRAIANAAWTDTVKANYKTWKESQEV